MYIWDALYGKIEFNTLINRCIMSPEVQRLREVRLCNINSLCITGSSNTNRFEHSVGTAYLASVNMESSAQTHLKLDKKTKETFIIAALLHDVANGPFGHSYEYIMEKQGFVPEKGLGDVLSFESSGVNQVYKFSPIFFGKLRVLNNILDSLQTTEVSKIIAGEHILSKLISSEIDLDNIDNVFRMAYHMGLSFTKEAPLHLAQNMYIFDGNVRFKREAEPYLNEWFEVRKRVYKFLLLNPQEFAGKYMLTEAMDILFECTSENKARDKDNKPVFIQWYYTDYELMTELKGLTEVWLRRKILLFDHIDDNLIRDVLQSSDEFTQKAKLKSYIQSLSLLTPIKDKGKSGNSNTLQLNDNYKFSISAENVILVADRNMDFEINGNKLYKVVYTKYNPSQIVARLMTGDLYNCLLILETTDVKKYPEFLDYSRRVNIEAELEARIKVEKEFSRLSIGVHPILDKNKTERQLSITFNDDNTSSVIGDCSSSKLLIGVFIKNEPFGLSSGKIPLAKHREKLEKIVFNYFISFFENGAKIVPMYAEADIYGY
ncbi:MAG: HD domain-containing protein [Deltaproteobacteria bacterium]